MAEAYVVAMVGTQYNDEMYDKINGYEVMKSVYTDLTSAEKERLELNKEFVVGKSDPKKWGGDIGYMMEAFGGDPGREYPDYFSEYGELKKSLPDAIIAEIAEAYDFFEVVEVDFHG